MLQLPETVSLALTSRRTSPVILVEVDILTSEPGYPEAYVTHYLTDAGGDTVAGFPGYIYNGRHYRKMVASPATVSISKDEAIDDVSIDMDNVSGERPWSLIFNDTPINKWIRSKMRIYVTFRELAERAQIYEGFLEIPNQIGDKITLDSKQSINAIWVEFPSLTYGVTCGWVSQFGQQRRCGYSGELTECDGTWETCGINGQQHRFGGLHTTIIRGSYSYKERRIFWFDKKKYSTYESEENTSLFGTTIPVIYGQIRTTLDIIWQLDAGDVNQYMALIGVGPIGGILDAPAYDREDISAKNSIGSGRPAVVLNGKLTRDYAFYRGWDGEVGQSTPLNFDGSQKVDYLWEYLPEAKAAYTYTPGVGQTFSRIAYIAGAWPSTKAKEADKISEIEAYLRGRVIDTYYGSDTTPDAGTEYRPQYSDNHAWVWLDILMNKDYGAGLPLSVFDIPKIRKAAYQCNAEGFSFSHVFKERMDVLEALQIVLGGCRGYNAYSDGKFYLVVQTKAEMEAKRAAGPVFTFELSSIVLRSDSYMSAPGNREANSIDIPYLDYDLDYQSVTRTLDDSENQRAVGRKHKAQDKVAGVVGLEHANKLSYFYLNRYRLMRREDGWVKVKSDFRALHVQIGDIVKVDNSDLDLHAPGVDPDYDGLYEVYSIAWEGGEGEFTLELADPAVFDATAVADDVEIEPIRSRTLYPYRVDLLECHEEILGDFSYLTVYWEVGAPPDSVTPIPVFVNVYWRRASDPIYLKTKAGRVSASTGYFRIEIPAAVWEEVIVIYLASESNSGVETPCHPEMNPLSRATEWTTFDAFTDNETPDWVVADGSIFDVDDYVVAGSEICKVESVAGNTITLVSDGGIRTTYEGTTAQNHAANEYLGLAWIPALSFEKTIRKIADTAWTQYAFNISIEGSFFVANWVAPSFPVRDTPGAVTVEVPSQYIKTFGICYSPNQDFNADITDPEDPDFDPDAIWVEDIPGNIRQKRGEDPGKTYYFAMRCNFYNGKSTAWAYKEGSGPFPPFPPEEYWRRREPFTSRIVATSRRITSAIPDPGIQPFVFDDDSVPTAMDARTVKLTTNASTAAMQKKFMVSGLAVLQWTETEDELSFMINALTGDWQHGWVGMADNVITYDASEHKLVVKGAELKGCKLTSTAEGVVIKSKRWSATGSQTEFDLDWEIASGSEVSLTVNGVGQDTSHYSTSTVGGVTRITTDWTPASGDILIAFAQKKAS